jgi:glucose-1-phosphate thymidylyltransferase
MRPLGAIVIEDAVAAPENGHSRTIEATARVANHPIHAIATIANRPIVLHVVDALRRAGIEEIVVASSTAAGRTVRECLEGELDAERTQLRFVTQHESLQLGGALRLLAPVVRGSPCLVHAGCGLLAEPLTAMVPDAGGGRQVIVAVHHAPSPDRRLTAESRLLMGLAELDPERSALGLAGVWGFGPGALERAAAGPLWRGDDLAGLARAIRDPGERIEVHQSSGWRAYRGDGADLLELNRIALDRLEHKLPREIADANRIEGKVRIGAGANVRDSVLIGPVVIGPRASVIDAYIGPYTAIGEGAEIEGAEIERSIVAEHARLTHVGRRLTDSVIGREARVFRDFSLPQALRLRLGDGTEVGLC